MKKSNKIIALLLSLVATLSMGLTVGCSSTATTSSEQSTANSSVKDSEQNNSTENTSSESSSEEESSEEESSSEENSDTSSEDESSSSEDSGDTPTPDLPERVEHDACVWGDWKLKAGADATCEEEGTKIRYCIYDYTHTQTEQFAARGHEYSKENGYCVRCDELVTIPALDANATFPLIDTCTHTDVEIEEGACDCLYKGRGEDYNRLELTVGCYTVEIGANNDIWLSFSVQEAGQYMLYSVDGTIAKATQHDASAQYIPMNGDYYVANEARELDGNFYSYVSCTNRHFSSDWRATFRIRAAEGTLVKICFVKISEAAWEAINQYEKVYPTQINGKKAPEPEQNHQKTAVEYDSEYFYSDPKDGGDGYYHLGTKENPGAIIYAAINSAPTRLLLNGTFSTIHYEGSALNLSAGYTAEGNYLIKNYVPFIMNSANDEDIFATNEDGSYVIDPNKNCYQNYCNSDGLYPVNQELFEFLNLYVANKMPIDKTITLDDWRNQEDWLWLSACYYYKEIALGSEENPLVLTVGEQELSLPATDFFYCTIAEAGTYKLTCSDSNVFISVDGGDYVTGKVTVIVTDLPINIAFASMDATTVTVTVEKMA